MRERRSDQQSGDASGAEPSEGFPGVELIAEIVKKSRRLGIWAALLFLLGLLATVPAIYFGWFFMIPLIVTWASASKWL
ncbi:MAG: hypothetical protein O2856_12210 [Planctomycetota bacterium]|nr:hypothetical protein [Planctomycetota bacterium]